MGGLTQRRGLRALTDFAFVCAINLGKRDGEFRDGGQTSVRIFGEGDATYDAFDDMGGFGDFGRDGGMV